MPDIVGNFGSMDEAVRYFRDKKNIPTRRWDELLHGMNAPAFTIAGATEEAFLADMHKAVAAAIEKGETLEDFRQRFDDIIRRQGWKMSGAEKADNAGYRAWRTSVIYHTNVRTAYMAGRWETLKHFPYLKYKHNTVNNPRKDHQEWDGLIIATDDPWWETHYPPNGWGCRCTVIGISKQRLGTQKPDAAPTPAMRDEKVPAEWRYNVGIAAFGRAIEKTATTDPRDWLPMDPYFPDHYDRPDIPFDAPTVPLAPRTDSIPEIRQRFRDLFGGDSVTFIDPTDAVMSVTQAMITHWAEKQGGFEGREAYLPLLREIIEDPYEIWVGFERHQRTGKVRIRRRYIKGLMVGKKKIGGVVLDSIPGEWVALTMFHGSPTGAKNLRTGRMTWFRK
ncbi:PBECR2 nuclease fold domain-containing protein [Luteimonas sp. FXH3W]|uniref:PBECR2 nuclease fold domain-containing protein n=1 Tax=Aquilutibacter rugosus TaxID=3115820 RepID=A0ABU7UVV3_9GAMM